MRAPRMRRRARAGLGVSVAPWQHDVVTATTRHGHGPQHEDDSPRALVLWGVVVVAASVVLGAAVFAVRHVLVLIYVCALVALGLSPLVRWIETRAVLAIGGRRPARWTIILVLYVLVVLVAAGVALEIVPRLLLQAQDLAESAPRLLGRAQGVLDAHGLAHVRLASLLPSAPNTNVFGTVLGAVTGILGGFFGAVTIVILTFYLLVDAERIRERWVRLCTTIGITAGIVLVLLGVPFAYVLAIIAAVGELVPYAGPFISGVIASSIAAASVSWHIALSTATYYVVQQLVENNVLQPKLMGHQVGLSAASVIIAVLIGGSLLGIVGAVLAVPTAAILEATLEEVTHD